MAQLTFKIDASDVLAKFEGLGEALTDFVRHAGDFRYALETLRDTADHKKACGDDVPVGGDHWQREIDVLDRILNVVEKLNATEPNDVNQPQLFES